MKRCAPMLALGLALCLASAGSFAAGEKKDADKKADKKLDKAKVATLIRQLGSESADEREAAARALEEIGPAALDSLRAAAAGGEGDIGLRARILIKKLEKRAEADRVIGPTMVKLAFKKKLVADAVAELAKKSGYRISISGDTTELKKRRITFDTDGEMPFWKAFDQLCLKASLVESDGQVRPGVPPRPGVPMPPFPNPMINPAKPELPPQIIVEDGNPVELPTYYSGAIRIRPLPSDSLIVASQRGDKETLVILEVTAEPKVQWQQLESIKLLKAVDEQGQNLEQVETPKAPGIPGAAPMPPRPMPPAGMPRQPGVGTPPSQVPIRFTLAAKPSKVFKELRGALVAKIQTPTQPLITVTDVLEATEKKFKGETGGAIEVLEIKAEKKGDVKVRLVLEVPPDVVEPVGPGVGVPGIPMPVPRPMVPGVPGVPGAVAAPKDTYGISLLDSRGRKFHPVAASSKQAVVNGNAVKEYTLTFQPQVGQGKAAKLVYEAARVATVEVPFTLTDVPLP